MKTNTTKIDRTALKSSIASVIASLGLKPANRVSDEEKKARADKRAAKRAARFTHTLDMVRTAKRTNRKGKECTVSATRRMDLAIVLAKNGVCLPDEFLAAYPLDKAANALIALGAVRGISEEKVREFFRLPASKPVVATAPESGGAIVKNITTAKQSKQARKSA